MKWILIIMIFGPDGNAVTTAEFNSKIFCELASTGVLIDDVRRGSVRAFCVPKGHSE